MEEVVRLTYCVGSTDSQSLRAPPMRFVCELVEEARKEEVDGTRDAMSADMASDPDTSRVEASSSDEGAEQTTTTLNDEPAAADKLPSSADADQVSAAEKEAPAVSKSEAEPVPEESEERWGVHAPSFEEMSRARQGGRTEGEQSSSSASVEPPRSRTQLVVKNAYWLRSAEMDMLVPER